MCNSSGFVLLSKILHHMSLTEGEGGGSQQGKREEERESYIIGCMC